MAQEDADQTAASIGTSALLDGLEGEARRDRAELVAWLMRRGFTADEIAASVTPMLLPANRVMGDDGVYVSTREMVHATGIDLELLQGMQRAAGLPRIDDPDAAVLPRADVEAATRAKYLLDFGVDPDDMLAIASPAWRALAQSWLRLLHAVLISVIGRSIGLEKSLHITTGHDQTLPLIQQYLDRLETTTRGTSRSTRGQSTTASGDDFS
jgi:hypothetical protein